MFTGLIETVGTVVSMEKSSGAALIGIRPDKGGFVPLPGASVAIDGVCLTLEHMREDVLYFTAVAETLSRTTIGSAKTSTRVNLEQAMVANGRFDGHLVLGHVDGVGTIAADHKQGAGILRDVRLPAGCVPLMAEKGSVAIDGISLTIAKLEDEVITIALIPRTLEATAMSRKRAGDAVNIECDVLARYVQRLLLAGKEPEGAQPRCASGGNTLLEHMERAGF